MNQSDEQKLNEHYDEIDLNLEKLKEILEPEWNRYDPDISPIKNQAIQLVIANTDRGVHVFNRLLAMADAILNHSALAVEEAFSHAFCDAKFDRDEDLGSTEAKIVAGTDKTYLRFKRQEVQVRKIHKKCKAMVDALESRRWMIKDLAALIIDGSADFIVEEMDE